MTTPTQRTHPATPSNTDDSRIHARNNNPVSCCEQVQRVGKAAMMGMLAFTASIATAYYASPMLLSDGSQYQAALLGQLEGMSVLNFPAVRDHVYQAGMVAQHQGTAVVALLALSTLSALATAACTWGLSRLCCRSG